MKKKLLLVALIGIIMFAFCSCDVKLIGKWKITEIAAGDVSMTAEDMKDMGLDPGYIKLNKSGSCEIKLVDEEFEGTWKSSGGDSATEGTKLTIKYNIGNEAAATFDSEGVMTFKDAQGTTYKLKK